jgi:uncharacterized repeat protein (TIGR01451 family)
MFRLPTCAGPRGCFALLLAALAGPAPALQLGIQLNPDRVRPAEAIVALITVSNDSAASVANVALQVRLPAAGVSGIYTSYFTGTATCPGSNYCEANEIANWNLGLIAPGSAVTVSMPVPVATGTPDGSVLTLPATVLVNGVQTLQASASVTVDGDHALELSLDADRNGVTPGDTLTYTLSYGNRSASSVTGTTLSLPLPAGTTFVSASGGGTYAAGAVNWSLGTLQAGQAARQQVRVTVGAGLASAALLSVDAAQIAGNSAVTGPELARATSITRVQADPALALAYAVNADPARPQEALRSTLTVSNRSAGTVFGTVLRARMPTAGVNGIYTSYFTGAATCPGSNFCEAYELVDWDIGTLAPGEAVTVSMPATVTTGFGSGRLIVNEAEVRADGVPMMLARHTVAADADNALSLALDADRDSARPGERLTYTLTYGNRSAASVTGTTLALPLPPGTTFVSASGGGTHSAGVVSWSLGTLQAGQSARQQVQVALDGGLPPGALLPVDAAHIGGSSAVTGAELARSTLVTRFHANPVLGLAYAVNADPARPQEALRSLLTVSNRSDATVYGARLRARMPTEGVAGIYSSYFTGTATCPGSNYCEPYELVDWALGTLAPGAAVTVSLPATVAAGFQSGRLIVNEAELRADGVPMMLARRTVSLDADHALTLAVDADHDSAAPGELLTYRLTFGNRGTLSITGATLVFPVPEGATLVGTGGGTLADGKVSWSLGTVLAGRGGVRAVTVRVPNPVSPAQRTLVVDAATIEGSSASTGPERAHGSRVTRIVANAPLQLALSIDKQPAVAGQPLAAVLRVTNTGPVPLISAQAQLRLPPEGIGALYGTTFVPPAACPGSNYCEPYELATWSLGTLTPGASVTLRAPLTVTAGLTAGRLIPFEARATDDAADVATASSSILVGSATDDADTDGDGVADAFDNCTMVANPDQADSDHDGYGNRCDADFDNNGNVNFADLAAFKAAFGSSQALYDLDASGSVNFGDLAVFKGLFGFPPGPSALRP